jgi:hypothetical protein
MASDTERIAPSPCLRSGFLLRFGIRQDIQYIPYRASLIRQLGQGQMTLHLVAVTTTLALLEDVARFSKVRHDGVRVPLGDAEFGGEISQADVRILRDAEQRSPVVAEEAPISHG